MKKDSQKDSAEKVEVKKKDESAAEEVAKVEVVHDDHDSSKKEHSHSSSKKHSTHTSTGGSKMKNDESRNWKIATGVLAVLLVVSLFANWDISISAAGSGSGGAVVDNGGAGDTGAAAPDFSDFVASDYYDAEEDPVLGEDDAPVTIIEFSDFECPFCARAYTTVKQVEEKYVASGQVKIVFRDFPLGFHAEAVPAAMAAECAQDQGMFWEYHDLIFENQGLLASSQYVVWAEELGLDMDAFNSCFDSSEHSAEITADLADGQKLGVQGTPSFFVNGVQISGAQPFSVFEAAIEAALEAS